MAGEKIFERWEVHVQGNTEKGSSESSENLSTS